jgi:hypothetical protein
MGPDMRFNRESIIEGFAAEKVRTKKTSEAAMLFDLMGDEGPPRSIGLSCIVAVWKSTHIRSEVLENVFPTGASAGGTDSRRELLLHTSSPAAAGPAPYYHRHRTQRTAEFQ